VKGAIKQNLWWEVSKRVKWKEEKKVIEKTEDEENSEKEPKEDKEEKGEKEETEDPDTIKIENVTITNMEDLNKLSSDYETVYEWKEETKNHKIWLNITKTLHGMKTLTTEMKSKAKERLWKLDDRDKKIYEKRKAKNDFEELIYKSWEWVNEDKN